MAAITFDFITDLRRFLPGMRQVSSELDQVETDLRDVASAGDRLERDMDSAFRDIRSGAGRAGREIADEIGDGTRRAGDAAKDGAREVGSELAENLSEGFQSGDFLGVAQETAASLTSGLAGVGGPLGAAAGVGAGAVALIVGQMKARADQIKEVGRAFGEQLAASMQDGLTAASLREATVEALKQSLEDAGMTMGDFGRLAATAGISIDELIATLMAGGPALDELRAKLDATTEAETRHVKGSQHSVTVVSERGKAAAALVGTLDRVAAATQQGTDAAIAEADALDGARKNTADYRRELERVQERVGRVRNSAALVEWLNENGRAAHRARREIRALIEAAEDLADVSIGGAGDLFSGEPNRGARTPRAHTRNGRRPRGR